MRVAIYLRRGRLYPRTVSKSTAGFWTEEGAFEVLEAEVDARALGLAVIEAARRSRSGVPVSPERYAASEAEVRRVSGVGFRAFQKSSLYVRASFGDAIELQPTENLGRKGFVKLGEPVRVRRDATPEEIGAAVRAAFALAR
jgi:hypothetical protein